ncbi:MAG: DUF2894 domain-containing protein [Hydrogenophaga sp.]|nr:DUF2894 domain-containing protein [Hydrogenophaga sp.]
MKPAAVRSPLAELNAHIERVSGVTVVGDGPWSELRSALRFRETWERLGAERQVQQARERAPQNAGPLNPHRLMLENLARMGELSPHYLRRFLAHAETLMWLEEAQGRLKSSGTAKPGPGAKPGKTSRSRK